MKSLILILLIGQCFAASKFSWMWKQKVEETGKAEFCGKYECPGFTVVQQFDGYQLRKYNATVWATVDMNNMQEDFWEDRAYQSQTFMKLFHYIQGANTQNVTMNMTVPVLMTHSKDSVSMAFMLPAKHASKPPTPKDQDVKIYKSPVGSVFVKSFDGFAYGLFGWTNKYKTNLATLEWELERDGHSFDTTKGFYTAGYDSPWKLFNRHNEVWVRQQ